MRGFFEFFKDEEGAELVISLIAKKIGCARGSLDKLKADSGKVGGYGLSFGLFLKAHQNAGMKLTDIII